MKKFYKRESNLELLRIFSMLLIVMHHFAIHGNFDFEWTTATNRLWILFLTTGGKIGANIFIMISGYFLINDNKISTEKILKLLLQMLFYSITTLVIFVGFLGSEYSFNIIIQHLLGYPIWWFAVAYLGLYLFHPYINRLLDTLDEEGYRKLLLLATLLLSFIPTITGVSFDGGVLIWFIYIYTLGGYLKKYPLKLKWPSYKFLLLSLLLYTICFLPVIIFYIFNYKITFATSYTIYIFSLTKFTTLLISLFLFLGFTKLNIKNNKFINLISSTTFGIYLIHDCDYMRTFLWTKLFKNASYAMKPNLIPYSIVVILIVFVTCSVIELGRMYLIERLYSKSLKSLAGSIDKGLNKISKWKIFNMT